ncbi:hypothetical protein CDL15_Pgr019256 [Punica granatum]|uniref:Uncharacterized protein n=1 Tax=Punica granatum TaxID=22663 RepID=A0A218Y149_PUNGR|nr:hypothetical protein CDL15_Pgr019256 [Punica granatum]
MPLSRKLAKSGDGSEHRTGGVSNRIQVDMQEDNDVLKEQVALHEKKGKKKRKRLWSRKNMKWNKDNAKKRKQDNIAGAHLQDLNEKVSMESTPFWSTDSRI